MAKEKYYLYLDESGNFWEDDPSDKISPSLVGGVLCTKELADESVAEQVHNGVVQNFINEFPQYKNADFNHATEAVAAEDKPELKLRMVEATIKAGYIPVVFQQNDKYFRDDSQNPWFLVIFFVHLLFLLLLSFGNHAVYYMSESCLFSVRKKKRHGYFSVPLSLEYYHVHAVSCMIAATN